MKCTRLRQQFCQFLIDLRSGSFWYTEMTGFKELIKRLYIRETCTQCFFFNFIIRRMLVKRVCSVPTACSLLQAVFASWIPEITELAAQRSKYGGTYSKDVRRRYTPKPINETHRKPLKSKNPFVCSQFGQSTVTVIHINKFEYVFKCYYVNQSRIKLHTIQFQLHETFNT